MSHNSGATRATNGSVITSSRSYGLFKAICDELLVRLEGETSAAGLRFLAETRTLKAVVDRWAESPPGQEERATMIARVMDLHRDAMEYLTESKRAQ